MNTFSRQNPFTRNSTLPTRTQPSPNRMTHISNPSHLSLPTSSPPSLSSSSNTLQIYHIQPIKQNPFTKFTMQKILDRKYHLSENKNYGYLPLSKYQNRKKLRQLDLEIWRRQKEDQERLKLQCYGAEALRYNNSYSTDYSSFHHQHNPYCNQYIKQTPSHNSSKQQPTRPDNYFSNNQYMLHLQKTPEPNIYNKLPIQTTNNNVGINNHNNKKIQSLSSGRQQYGSIQSMENNHHQIIPISKKQNDDYQFLRTIQQRQAPYFNGNYQSFDDQLKKNFSQVPQFPQVQHFPHKLGSFGQYGSLDDDSYGKQLQKNQKYFNNNTNKQTITSYTSKPQKQAFYQSDFINQQQQTNIKGPLNQLKFSTSSINSQVQPIKVNKLSTFGKKIKGPDYICYNGQEFYKIDLVL